MSEAMSDRLIGKVLSGRFEIRAPLGEGGRGRVYRAIQRPLDRDVAVKVLDPRLAGTSDPDFEEGFFLEALLTAKLRHPNTITIHDYGRAEEGIYFIAMELLEGVTLQRRLVEGGQLPWARALSMGVQVARSLREAHKLGLVHGGLSPGNIMMVAEGPSGDHVKVLDYGQARKGMGPAYRLGSANRLELTPTAALLGNLRYVAPERARSELDPRSDIYSLGAVLYMAIAGRTPFLGQSPLDIIAKQLRETAPELKSFADVPDAVNGLVMKCLERVPEARFADADELLDAMRLAAVSNGVTGLFSHPHPRPSVARRAPVVDVLATHPVQAVQPPIPSVPLPRGVQRELAGPLNLWRSAWRGAPGQPRPWWRRLVPRR
jgi:eukaryotic-like serine/threonine-protein kinase